MFLIKLCAVELVATLLGALTTLHTDLKSLRLEDAYTVEGIRIGDYAFHKSPTATHRDSAIEYCKLKGQSLMYVQPAFDLPRIFKEMEVNKAWIDVAKANSRADWKDPLGKKLYLKTSTEGFSVQQATDMLENANELSTTEEGITKGVILSKETASKFIYKEIDKEGDVTAICFKPLAFPYREDDLKQMSKWRDHFVQAVNDTMSFVVEQQDMIKSYHTFFPGYNGTIPNDAKENMIDLHEKLEIQVTECTAKLGEIKGGLITIFVA
jgi:hypothetical protein